MRTRAKDRTRRSKPYSGPKGQTMPGRYDGYPANHSVRTVSMPSLIQQITNYVFNRGK